MALLSFSKLRGIIGSIFQIGIGSTAVNLKEVTGVLQVKNKADSAYANARIAGLVLDDAGTHKVTITQPTTGSDLVLILPANAGTSGYVLQTDGAGTLTWASAGTTADCMKTDTTTLAFGSSSPVTMFTMPANAVMDEIIVYVDTAFNGTAPTMSVGITGTTSKYLGTSDVDLKTVNEYHIPPGVVADAGTNALIITYAADSSSAGSARVVVKYSIPA